MKKTLLWAAFLQGFAVLSLAQRPDAALNTLATRYPTERVYIHYDKEHYVAGETIWLKAYLYSNGLPSTLSNNFYLQLIDGNGNTVINKKYPVKGATVNGDIELPDSLPQGYYHIRALTPAMMNHHPDFLYSKNIFVFNEDIKTSGSFRLPAGPSLSLQFFPESGQLVADVLSAVVFKATDSLGRPVNINGVIKTDDGTLINSFKTFTPGMGKLQFRPQAGKKYVAAVEINGQTAYYPLPEVKVSGISLRIENEKGGKMFLLSRSKKEKSNPDQLWLTAVINDLIVYESEINFDTYSSVKGHLLTDSMPSGIIHFTVFDKEGTPLAERLTFVDNGEYASQATMEILKKGTGPREENIIEISFPDLVQRSLSVAVTDEELCPVVKQESIISELLLTDDLRGNIDNPGWYFQDRNDSVRQVIFDNLLFTRNWQRFSWQKIMAGEFPEKKYKDPYLISVAGSLKDSKTNSTVAGGELTLFMESEDSVNHNFEIPVDENGKFTIDSLLFYGKASFFYVYRSAQGKEKAVSISLFSSPEDIAVQKMPFAFDRGDLAGMDTGLQGAEGIISKRPVAHTSVLSKTKNLDPVIVESKSYKRPVEIVNEKYSSGAFTAMGKLNFDNINNPENNRSLSVYDFVKRSIKNLLEEKGQFVNTKNFSLFKPSTDEYYKKKQDSVDALGGAPGSTRFIDLGIRERGDNYIMDVFINENPTRIDFLKTIRMDEVALIKFYEPGFFGSGMNGPGGSLVVYTKKEIVTDDRIEKLDHVKYNGYSIVKHFYSPDYSNTDLKQMTEDTRTTLYWDPDLYTDNNSKKIRLKFYNNDISKKLRIVVEGFDARGRLIHIEKIIPE
ncbi:MAG TPA: hypothetical protein VGO58_11435 [Chitinophagaceae bacterium]|jgi:hypothetical protein|nr:hypothetical protein [Chitinophagaceae bacterium]